MALKELPLTNDFTPTILFIGVEGLVGDFYAKLIRISDVEFDFAVLGLCIYISIPPIRTQIYRI